MRTNPDKFLQWINGNAFWKSEFINYRDSNLDLFFDPKLQDAKNVTDYYIEIWLYFF